MNGENGEKVKTFQFKGQGKYPLKYTWTVIKEDSNNEATTVSFDEKIPAVEQQEKSASPIRIELIDTDNSFLIGKPKGEEIIIIRKPGKTDIFVPDLKLAEKIAVELSKIKEKWAPSLWCANPELTTVSALGTMSRKKINGKIVPVIEKITKDFYGDDK